MTKSKLTLTKLIAESSIPASLIRAVVRQIGGWESFTESAPDIANHGIDGGFHGFIYTKDTEAFSRKYLEEIREHARYQADEFGTTTFAMIAEFNCFKGNEPTADEIAKALYTGKESDDSPNILNALAWYAGEEVARAYVDLTERE